MLKANCFSCSDCETLIHNASQPAQTQLDCGTLLGMIMILNKLKLNKTNIAQEIYGDAKIVANLIKTENIVSAIL